MRGRASGEPVRALLVSHGNGRQTVERTERGVSPERRSQEDKTEKWDKEDDEMEGCLPLGYGGQRGWLDERPVRCRVAILDELVKTHLEQLLVS